MQAAADGADRQIKHFGDCFVATAVDFAQYDHGPIFFRELCDCPAHPAATFLSFEAFGRVVFFIRRFQIGVFPCAVHRNHRPASPLVADGRVKGDPVQPSVKLALAAERLQLDERLDQRLLDDVSGVLGVADHVEDRVEEPVLVFQDQFPKGLRLARKRLVYQLGVVAHCGLSGI